MASPDPIASPPVDLVANKYRLSRLIGRGGMGSVWEGIHITLGNRVAVKFIESDYADSDEARSRFENEARAAARLQSKHVVQVFDYGVMPDGRPFIVMEYLAGESLDARLEKQGRMSVEETTRIITQVSRALAKAHAAGIVHRDLKPENVFLVHDDDDSADVAKVVDFGIAKFTDTSMGVSSSTRTGSVLGTPYYMSPEQARGLRSVDFRSDLWSLAVITFRCLTGRYPFEGEAIGDLLVKICTAPLPKPSEIAQTPPAFDAWFEKAMQREPALRFASASEFAEQLAVSCGVRNPRAMQPSASQEINYEAGAQARSVRDDTSMPTSRTLGHTSVNRRSGLALAAAVAAVFLVVTAVGVWWLVSRKSNTEHAASAAPSAPTANVVSVAPSPNPIVPSAPAAPLAVVATASEAVSAPSVAQSAAQSVASVASVVKVQAAAQHQQRQPKGAASAAGNPPPARKPADLLGY